MIRYEVLIQKQQRSVHPDTGESFMRRYNIGKFDVVDRQEATDIFHKMDQYLPDTLVELVCVVSTSRGWLRLTIDQMEAVATDFAEISKDLGIQSQFNVRFVKPATLGDILEEAMRKKQPARDDLED